MGLQDADIRGTGYDPAEDIRNGIFEISTFIDEDFAVTPAVDSWQSASYDDSKWASDGWTRLLISILEMKL